MTVSPALGLAPNSRSAIPPTISNWPPRGEQRLRGEGLRNLPGSALFNPTWGKIAPTQLVVHGWDIATATGQAFDLPEHTLQACLEHVAVFVPNAPSQDLWGPPVEVP